VILLCLVIVYTGCSINPATFKPYDFYKELQNKTLERKLDQLVIILDTSISMIEPYMGQEKFKTAILTLHHINASLSTIKVPIGFHVLGTGSCHFCKKTRHLFHITPYDHAKLDINQLKKINPGGETPLKKAILEIRKEFRLYKGKKGLIVISDFEMNHDSVKKAFQPLINKYGQQISVCCIQVGPKERTGDLARILTSLHPGIQCIHAEQVLSYNNLKHFVQDFFLQPLYDHDHDGVPDKLDHCHNTPSGAWVDAKGCPKDTDNDGVFEGIDQCNNTYKGAPVNEKGCWQLPALFYSKNQLFMTRKQEKKLASFVEIIKKNHICIEIQGHTDHVGSKKNNMTVSFKRAQSVMAYFLSLGLRHYQMQIKALGASVPIDHQHATFKNATQRRVTFEVVECQKQ